MKPFRKLIRQINQLFTIGNDSSILLSQSIKKVGKPHYETFHILTISQKGGKSRFKPF